MRIVHVQYSVCDCLQSHLGPNWKVTLSVTEGSRQLSWSTPSCPCVDSVWIELTDSTSAYRPDRLLVCVQDCAPSLRTHGLRAWVPTGARGIAKESLDQGYIFPWAFLLNMLKAYPVNLTLTSRPLHSLVMISIASWMFCSWFRWTPSDAFWVKRRDL